MNATEYREVYLRSEHWLRTRHAALKRADHRCQVCNGDQALDVHHRTYERLGAELPGDLTVLCRDCHALFHARLPKRRPHREPRPGTPKIEKALSKRQRRAQRKRDGKPGAHARAMAEMRARNEGRA
jgi:5-methylcytosine-specific restriction endonuclease McrA